MESLIGKSALDFFGFRRDILAGALTFESASEMGLLKPEVTQEEWDRDRPSTPEKMEEFATEYFDFAMEKASSHRGLSAIRSVDKLSEIAWLMGRNDVVFAMATAPYLRYGVPKLREFARGMGDEYLSRFYEFCVRNLGFTRMADGEECTPGCTQGCNV